MGIGTEIVRTRRFQRSGAGKNSPRLPSQSSYDYDSNGP